MYRGRFSTQADESASHTTHTLAGCTGRGAGREHGNKVWNREREQGRRELYRSGGFFSFNMRFIVLQHSQESNAVIERLSHLLAAS